MRLVISYQNDIQKSQAKMMANSIYSVKTAAPWSNGSYFTPHRFIFLGDTILHSLWSSSSCHCSCTQNKWYGLMLKARSHCQHRSWYMAFYNKCQYQPDEYSTVHAWDNNLFMLLAYWQWICMNTTCDWGLPGDADGGVPWDGWSKARSIILVFSPPNNLFTWEVLSSELMKLVCIILSVR